MFSIPFDRLLQPLDAPSSEKSGDEPAFLVENRIPARSEIAPEDTWNLQRIFKTDALWEKEFESWKTDASEMVSYRGKLGDSDVLAEYLEKRTALSRRVEKLYIYAFLKTSEDVADTAGQERRGRLIYSLNQFEESTSFVRPELLARPKSNWKAFRENPRLAPWQLILDRIIRFKKHTLSAREEKLLALAGEAAQAPERIFDFLNDVDLQFKPVKNEQGVISPLTQETFSVFLRSQDRRVRKDAFHHFYEGYKQHRNTLAATLTGSIQKDVFYSRARNYSSAIGASLFGENIPVTVYNHLIEGVHAALPTVYRYYELRRRLMKLKEIHFYDTYVPIVANIQENYPWNTAVEMVLKAFQPLGTEYCRQLKKGLVTDRWVDKYENINKSGGAFSMPGYDSSPYILLNYKPQSIGSVFTLAHEAGHSMHSWFSAKTQPYQYYDYEIFLAEIASTFNEQLLTAWLLKNVTDTRQRAWLINRQIDDIRATIIRQTMFSEFERDTHGMAESGTTLTTDAICSTYRKLLEQYFGPDFMLDEELNLECLRIPHFYRAFYVYKYATGLSAAIALSRRVLEGGEKERLDYFELLQGGCADEPLNILRRAGVDMEKPEPVQLAMKRLEELVNELEELLM